MIAQKFITQTLSSNPSISELAQLADRLDARAGECFGIARAAHEQHNNAVAVRFNDIGIDAQDTATALRGIVYEAMQHPFAPSDLDTAA